MVADRGVVGFFGPVLDTEKNRVLQCPVMATYSKILVP